MVQIRSRFALSQVCSIYSPASVAKLPLSLALACALAFGSLAAQQGTPAPSPKKTASAEKTSKKPKAIKTTEESKASNTTKEKPEPARQESEEEIDIPVPDGVPVKGIKVPSYSTDGKLLMMLDAEQARKLDAERIEFENLKIDAYSDDDKKIYVELPRSIFNLTTRILTSESRVLIRREDFVLVGDAGEFHTKNRFAKILGNVKMTILNTENFDTP
jgi:hypothetical protein